MIILSTWFFSYLFVGWFATHSTEKITQSWIFSPYGMQIFNLTHVWKISTCPLSDQRNMGVKVHGWGYNLRGGFIGSGGSHVSYNQKGEMSDAVKCLKSSMWTASAYNWFYVLLFYTHAHTRLRLPSKWRARVCLRHLVRHLSFYSFPLSPLFFLFFLFFFYYRWRPH